VSIPWDCTRQPELARNKKFRGLQLLVTKTGNLSEEESEQLKPLQRRWDGGIFVRSIKSILFCNWAFQRNKLVVMASHKVIIYWQLTQLKEWRVLNNRKRNFKRNGHRWASNNTHINTKHKPKQLKWYFKCYCQQHPHAYYK